MELSLQDQKWEAPRINRLRPAEDRGWNRFFLSHLTTVSLQVGNEGRRQFSSLTVDVVALPQNLWVNRNLFPCILGIKPVQNRQGAVHVAGCRQGAEMVFSVPRCQSMGTQLFYQFIGTQAPTTCQHLEAFRRIVGQSNC